MSDFGQMISQVEQTDVSEIIDPIMVVVAFICKLLMRIVGVIGLFIVGGKLTIDLIFIHNKPFFYKIAEAKKACRVEGEAGIGARLGKLGTGFVNTVGTQGPVGVLTYLLALLPNGLVFSSYILPNGEIDQQAADNATMITWVATKLWKQILAAVICGFVASGLLFDILQGAIIVSERLGQVGTVVEAKITAALDEKLGTYESNAFDDGTIGFYIINEATKKAQGTIPTSFYKFSGVDLTNTKVYLEEHVKAQVQGNSIYNAMGIADAPYNANSLVIGVKCSLSKSADKATTEPSDKVDKFNSNHTKKDKDNTWMFMVPVTIPSQADGVILCSDVNYPENTYMVLQIAVQLKASEAYITSFNTKSSGDSESSDSENNTTLTKKDASQNIKVIFGQNGIEYNLPVSYYKTDASDPIEEIKDELENQEFEGKPKAEIKNLKEGETITYEIVVTGGSTVINIPIELSE